MHATSELTPTQLESHERSKRFRQEIALRAERLANPVEELRAYVPPPYQPPIPNAHIAAACEIVFPSWVNEIMKIKAAVARDFGVSVLDIDSARRTAKIVLPRQVAMYLCQKFSRHSLEEIGRRFGGRDHSSVHHSVGKMESVLPADQALFARVNAISESLGLSL